MNGQFIYSTQDISPILFKSEAMGSKTAIKIAGIKGQVCLPRLAPSNDPHGFEKVIPPDTFDQGVLHLIHQKPDRVYWGKQVRGHSGESAVGTFQFEFKLAQTKPAARSQMSKVESDLEQWFGLLRSWMEVITHQDLSIDEPKGGAVSRGNQMWSWKARRIARNMTASTLPPITMRIPDFSKASSLASWQSAVQKADLGQRPPAPHLLMRDARARLLRQDYKYSVIFSGIACEVVIKSQIETELLAKRNEQQFIDQILKNTLGSLLNTCQSLGISLPPNLQNELVQVRNKAIHRNAAITREEAQAAYNAVMPMVAGQVPI